MEQQKAIIEADEGTAALQNSKIQEDDQMKEFDFDYFGTGAEGYAQYMTAFERNFGTDTDGENTVEESSFSDMDATDEDF